MPILQLVTDNSGKPDFIVECGTKNVVAEIKEHGHKYADLFQASPEILQDVRSHRILAMLVRKYLRNLDWSKDPKAWKECGELAESTLNEIRELVKQDPEVIE